MIKQAIARISWTDFPWEVFWNWTIRIAKSANIWTWKRNTKLQPNVGHSNPQNVLGLVSRKENMRKPRRESSRKHYVLSPCPGSWSCSGWSLSEALAETANNFFQFQRIKMGSAFWGTCCVGRVNAVSFKLFFLCFLISHSFHFLHRVSIFFVYECSSTSWSLVWFWFDLAFSCTAPSHQPKLIWWAKRFEML